MRISARRRAQNIPPPVTLIVFVTHPHGDWPEFTAATASKQALHYVNCSEDTKVGEVLCDFPS
jgi:hypothetical protein